MTPTPRKPDPGLIAAAVAIGSIGTLVALSVLGILTSIPRWAAVLIVVVELLMPVVVFRIVKRAYQKSP